MPSRSGDSESFASALAQGGHRAGAMSVRAMDRIARQVRSATGISEIGGRPGVADFRQERSSMTVATARFRT